MNITIYQSINIHTIKIGSITNSSVLQIGSTGCIQAHADIHNTGGFTEAAEELTPTEAITETETGPSGIEGEETVAQPILVLRNDNE